MGLKECNIVLDNPWNTYYAGQTINGRADFTFDSPKKIRGIVIKFLGEAHTSWNITENRTDNEGKTHEEMTNLTGNEEYFQIQYYLLGGKNAEPTELPPGKHSYPFTCALPPTLPSSFEGEFGQVRYTIKVTLDRPWKFDQDTKMAFTVISPVDLNLNPRVKEPHKLALSKTFCCFCCKSGPLSLTVSVPHTGFVSGQTIPIIVDCDNNSSVEINRINLKLRKIVSFHVHTPRRETKKDKITITELVLDGVGSRGSNAWQKEIEIPPLPPSNLVNCQIIDLDYDLKVEADVSGAHKNLEGSIPITLGTIPLVQPNQQYNAPITDPSMLPTQPVSPASPQNGTGGAMGWSVSDSAANNLYPNIPPPTFVATEFKAPISDRHDSQYTRFAGGTEYSPRYPAYQFPSAPKN